MERVQSSNERNAVKNKVVSPYFQSFKCDYVNLQCTSCKEIAIGLSKGDIKIKFYVLFELLEPLHEFDRQRQVNGGGLLS